MTRLPEPGADTNSWGDILNDFLRVSHDTDGRIKAAVLDEQLGTRLDAKLDTTARGTANGVAPLDGSSIVPAANMRIFNDRGTVQNSTLYNKWDTVVYNGRRVLITAAYTSSASGFISGANYIQLGGQHIFYAYDYGFRADGSQSSATSNVTALRNAITAAAAVNGGTVVLPFGYGFINAPVELKGNVWLQGSSTYGTVLQLTDGANCHAIINHVSTNGTSDANAMWCGVMNLTIDGRKGSQSGAGPYYGIYFNTNPYNTAASADVAFDPTHLIMNVHVRNAYSDGIHLNGRSDTRVGYCKASFCNGNGFRSTFDTHFDHCISEAAGLAGFLVQNSSVQFTGCKSYLSGKVVATEGHGFVVQNNGIGEIAFVGCDAQQVAGYGFSVVNAGSISIEGCNVSQSSYANGTAFCSYNFDGASYCTMSGTSQNTVAANALRLVNGANKNIIHVTHAGTGIGSVLTGDSALLSNFVVANGDLLSPGVELTARKGQPNGYAELGADGLVPASQLPVASGGNVALFGLGFFGDGSDGAVTLDGSNAFSWATIVSGTTYRLTRNIYCASIVINAGITLDCRGFVIHVATALSGSGSIIANGSTATSSSGAFGAVSGTLLGGKAGGAGSAAATGAAGTVATSAFGGAGGNGGNGSVTNGGAGGTATPPAASEGGLQAPRSLPAATSGFIVANSAVRPFASGAGGGGGGGDGTNAGGGGGGSGGVLIINAKLITGPALSFQAVGGGGFSPTVGNAGGGGGGGGGLIIVNTTVVPTGVTTLVTGGAGAAGRGTGTAGTAGAAGTVITNVFG